MDDYVSREAAFETLSEYYHHRTEIQHNALREALNRTPAADVRPVVHGNWIETSEPAGWADVYCACCSVCGESFILGEHEFDDLKHDFQICPACGADMRGEADNGQTV